MRVKKIICFLLLGVLLISLTGCFGGDEVNTDTEKQAQEEQKNTLNEETEFSMGEWNGNVYTNDFLDIKFTLPEGWEIATDEEIAEMMNLGTELLNDEQQMLAEVAKLTSAYYAYASDPNTGNNMVIFSEKTLVDATMEYYISQVKKGLTSLDSIEYEEGESSTKTIKGREYSTFIMEIPEYNMAQKYYLYKQDNYFIGIIVTSTIGEEAFAEIEKSFE